MQITKSNNPISFIRPNELALLARRVDSFSNQYRQNIAIVGHEGLGKTKLLFNLLSRHKNDKFIPVYISIRQKSFELLAKKFMGVLLYQFLVSENETIEDDLIFLITKAKPKIPKTVRLINAINKLIRDSASHDEILSSLLDLTQLLYDESNKPVLLILDEFHNLEGFDLKNPYQELSNKIMVQKNTMYIVISSAIQHAKTILSKKLSLLFGNFEIIYIEPFDNETSKEFLHKEFAPFTVAAHIKNFVTYFCGGYPFYLEVIAEQIKATCHEKSSKSITEDILVSSLEETLHKEHGILNQYFSRKYHLLLDLNHNNLFAPILMAIAQGKKKPAKIAAQIGRKVSEVTRCLNRLILMDIVIKKGVFNEIRDPLFARWLKFVLSQQQFSFNTDITKAAGVFKQNIYDHYELFISESQKKVSLRLKEIFELFENDIVELDRKRFMLTHFNEIDIKDINGISLVNARRLKKSWLCGIENDFVDEAKIGNFIKDASSKEYIKKILIALEGIDVNARLKAMEAKVWIWDQKTLNELLTLFEKPRFVK